jgi:hypothetical protein
MGFHQDILVDLFSGLDWMELFQGGAVSLQELKMG